MRQDLAHTLKDVAGRRYTPHKSGWTPHPALLGEVDLELLEDVEESPRRIPMRPRMRSHEARRSGFRFGVLQRGLAAQVGRPWNEVFSELLEKLPGDRVWDIREAIGWAVQTNCRLASDGSVCWTRDGHQWWPVRGMYVHPETGILCEATPPAKPVRLPKVVNPLTGTMMEGAWARDNYRPIDKSRFAQRENGIWYIYQVAVHAPTDTYATRWDWRNDREQVITYGEVPAVDRRYIASKKQACRRRLRVLGVRNDPAA